MQSTIERGLTPYRTVDHGGTLVAALLDVALQRAGIKWLEQFERAEQFARNTHDSTPIVELAAVLFQESQ